ncbi:Rpn family recombination-promoting nuclease/putative transposase [Geminocystis sp.]|uniref:Rpn family recombination-promoting nuclease/putative transposase n=1 Tax=Geminocystis sp. TaxID=2664100 RepID=UPI0035931BB9
MSYDSILKFLVEDSPEVFVNWLLNTNVEQEITILNIELNLEPIRADGLFFLTVADKILHLEFQTSPQSKPPIPLRMLDYWVRLYRQYETDIEQVVIYLKPSTLPDVFINEFRQENTSHRYRVIRIWEENPELFLKSPALYPLAVLAKSDNPEQLLQQIADEVAKINDKRERNNVSTCVQLLAGIKFDLSLINLYFREDIMQESVVYNKIIEKGIQQGIQQGIQETKIYEVQLILRLLKKRLGNINPQLQNKIGNLSFEELENLGEDLLDFQNESDLSNWLQSSDSHIDS